MRTERGSQFRPLKRPRIQSQPTCQVNIFDKLRFREIGAELGPSSLRASQFFERRNSPKFKNVPRRLQIPFDSITTSTPELKGHVILAFTKDGSYLISYRIDHYSPSVEYFVEWWRFDFEHRPLIKVASVRLFSGLDICQFNEALRMNVSAHPVLTIAESQSSSCFIAHAYFSEDRKKNPKKNYISIIPNPVRNHEYLHNSSIHFAFESYEPHFTLGAECLKQLSSDDKFHFVINTTDALRSIIFSVGCSESPPIEKVLNSHLERQQSDESESKEYAEAFTTDSDWLIGMCYQTTPPPFSSNSGHRYSYIELESLESFDIEHFLYAQTNQLQHKYERISVADYAGKLLQSQNQNPFHIPLLLSTKCLLAKKPPKNVYDFHSPPESGDPTLLQVNLVSINFERRSAKVRSLYSTEVVQKILSGVKCQNLGDSYLNHPKIIQRQKKVIKNSQQTVKIYVNQPVFCMRSRRIITNPVFPVVILGPRPSPCNVLHPTTASLFV